MAPEIFTLHGQRNRWRFSTLGGRMVAWEGLDGRAWRPICRGDGAKKPSQDAHRACVMFPWVNRIGGDHWALEGEPVPVDVSRPNAHLHGRVVDAEWDARRVDEAEAVFAVTLEASPYYPRRLECEIAYRMAELDGREGLEVAITALNPSPDPNLIAYITTGIHPYFLNPFGGPVDEMALQVPAAREFAVDEKLIPTGLIEVTPEHDFRAAREIGATRFDTGFVLNKSQPLVARLSHESFQLEIARGENCDYAQVYIPPHREEIAIEPQSGGVDAFRAPEYGLRRLRGGESFTVSMRFAASF